MREVELTVEDGVAIVTLAAPERRNAFTTAMAEEFIECCRSIDQDPTIAVTVLRANGQDFSAGGDRSLLQRVGEAPFADDAYAGLRTVYDSFVAFGSLRTPTIAAVQGNAVGAGLNLALSADLRVVARDATLMSGFLRIGIHPGGGHFHLLGRLVGHETATAMAVFGETVSGDRAVDLGLAWRSAPADEISDLAVSMARRIAGDPELARATVRSWRLETGDQARWASAVDIERVPQMRSLYRKHAP